MLPVQQLFSSIRYLIFILQFSKHSDYIYFIIDRKSVLKNHITCTKYLCFNFMLLLQLYKDSPELKRHFYFKTDPLTSQIDNLSPTTKGKIQVIIESLSNHSGEIIINSVLPHCIRCFNINEKRFTPILDNTSVKILNKISLM